VQGTGDVGFGTSSPAASLEVTRSDGTSQIRVEETGADATRTLFHLLNPGRTHFKIENTDVGSEWVFTNAGSVFFISLQGTGGPEFKILSNGNAVLAGTLTENSDVNSKQDIEPVDGRNILEKIAQLEVSEWSYKKSPKTRHIGPMAQDFRAAFGLGHTNKGISTLDSSGVALAAIKELIEENVSLREDNALLKKRLDSMEQQQVQMQAAMAKFLDSQQAHSVLTSTVMN
jgi:hypothetical protein